MLLALVLSIWLGDFGIFYLFEVVLGFERFSGLVMDSLGCFLVYVVFYGLL